MCFALTPFRYCTMKTLLFSILLSLSCAAVAQQAGIPEKVASGPFVMGVTDNIHATILGEDRTLNIYLPDGYAKDTAHYPVIYLLDGSADEDFIHIAGLTQFLTMINVLPPSIVVGIGNVDRKRDFVFPLTNPEHRKLVPTAGGSEKFMDFIEKELQPYIVQHYRTSVRKTLIGQSLGGLFATEVLLRKPLLFTDYIIVSPSLWLDDESLLKKAPGLLLAAPASGAHVFIAVGSEGKQMIGDAEKLAALLKRAAGSKMQVSYVPMPAENHLTILHRAVYKAFEVLNPVMHKKP